MIISPEYILIKHGAVLDKFLEGTRKSFIINPRVVGQREMFKSL